MRSLLNSFGHGSRKAGRKTTRPSRPLALEQLENRELLSLTATTGLGHLITLENDGKLYDQISPTNPGSRVQIDTGVSSIAVAGDGDLIALRSSGLLRDQIKPMDPSDAAWRQIDSGVQSFFMTGNGDVVAKENSGHLYAYVASALPRSPFTVAQGLYQAGVAPTDMARALLKGIPDKADDDHIVRAFQAAGVSYSDTAQALKEALNEKLVDTVLIFYVDHVPPTQIAEAVKAPNAYGATDDQVALAMRLAGVSASDTATALQKAFGDSPDTTTFVMYREGTDPTRIAQGLITSNGATDDQVALWMRLAGVSASDTGTALKIAFNDDLARTALTMYRQGTDPSRVAPALKAVYSATYDDVTWAFHAAGVNFSDTAAALNVAYGVHETMANDGVGHIVTLASGWVMYWAPGMDSPHILGAGIYAKWQEIGGGSLGRPLEDEMADPVGSHVNFQNHWIIYWSPQFGAEVTNTNHITSNNWSGYVVTASQVNAVGGTWIVPSVSGTAGNADSSVWIGIDGEGSDTVEQIGTEQKVVDGKASYSAWVEFFGDQSLSGTKGTYYDEYRIPLNIDSGDTISARVSFVSSTSSTSTFRFDIQDTPGAGGKAQTWGQSLTTQYVVPKRVSGEWIAEAPTTSGSLATLANFGTVRFTGAWATIGIDTGPINAFANYAMQMSDPAGGGTSLPTHPMNSNTRGLWQSSGVTSSSFSVSYSSTDTDPPASPRARVNHNRQLGYGPSRHVVQALGRSGNNSDHWDGPRIYESTDGRFSDVSNYV